MWLSVKNKFVLYSLEMRLFTRIKVDQELSFRSLKNVIQLKGLHYVGFFISPEKPGLIPTFCKRINRTSTAVRRWVAAFEERRRTT